MKPVRTWRLLGGFARRAPRQRITRGGLAFTLAALLVGIAAVVSANNLLFLIVAAMLSTVMVSGLVSQLSLAGLELDFQLPEHLSARLKVGARIQVRNSKRWMPSFSVHLTGSTGSVLSPVYFQVIAGGAVVEEIVEVRFQRRGIHRESSFQFSTSFPFGFLERRALVALPREVLVYPSIEPQPGFDELLALIRGDLEVHQRGLGRDFYRIRPYQAFESARHVDWKATAHTGALQVREFAREEERLLEIFLDAGLPAEHQAWFEQAVECCAFLAWRVAERGARLRIRSQEFDLSMPETGDVYTVLRALALVAPAEGRPPLVPGDDNNYQVVFSASDPQRLAELGWSQARIFGPQAFPAPAAPAT